MKRSLIDILDFSVDEIEELLATAKDNAALRAAKYALSGMVPIVGSTVSGSLSILFGSLSEARALCAKSFAVAKV